MVVRKSVVVGVTVIVVVNLHVVGALELHLQLLLLLATDLMLLMMMEMVLRRLVSVGGSLRRGGACKSCGCRRRDAGCGREQVRWTGI